MTFRLQFLDEGELGFGSSLRHEIVHACFRRNCSRSHGIVARNHDRFDTDFSQIFKLLFDAFLDDIFQIDNAENLFVPGNDEGRPAFVRNSLNRHRTFIGIDAALRFYVGFNRVRTSFADMLVSDIDAAHASLCGEFDKIGFQFGNFFAAEVKFIFREDYNTSSFRRFVRDGGKLSGFRKVAFGNISDGDKFAGLTVAEGNGTRLVEEEHVYVARRFDCTAAGGKDVRLIQSRHARDTDGGKQGADRRRSKTNEQSDDIGKTDGGALSRLIYRKFREGQKGSRYDEEDNRQSDEKNLQRDFVGGLFTACAFDHGNHFIEETLSRFRRHANNQPVAGYRSAARYGAPVSARFADDGGRFSRDRAFVYAGDADDDFAVHGDLFARFDEDDISGFEFVALDFRVFRFIVRFFQLAGDDVATRFFQALRLGAASAFCNCFREIAEQRGKPKNNGDTEYVPASAVLDSAQ